jgi:hypothetical protein
LRVVDHPPSQLRDLLGPQADFDRQQEDEAVPGRVPRGGEISQRGINLALAQRLGLFSQSHFVLQTHYLWAAGRWTVISMERQYMPTRKYSLAVEDLAGTGDRRAILSSVQPHKRLLFVCAHGRQI